MKRLILSICLIFSMVSIAWALSDNQPGYWLTYGSVSVAGHQYPIVSNTKMYNSGTKPGFYSVVGTFSYFNSTGDYPDSPATTNIVYTSYIAPVTPDSNYPGDVDPAYTGIVSWNSLTNGIYQSISDNSAPTDWVYCEIILDLEDSKGKTIDQISCVVDNTGAFVTIFGIEMNWAETSGYPVGI